VDLKKMMKIAGSFPLCGSHFPIVQTGPDDLAHMSSEANPTFSRKYILVNELAKTLAGIEA
jgi:hypothetical protein